MLWLQGPTYHRLNNMSLGNLMVDISAYDLELNCGAHCDLHCHDNHISTFFKIHSMMFFLKHGWMTILVTKI